MAEVEDQPDEPALVSLGEVLRTPPDRHGKRLRLVVAAIDGLHGVPAIRPIEVRITTSRDDILGRYIKHSGTGEPERIEVSRRRNDRLELTFAHEVGHLLEGALIPPPSRFGVRNWTTDVVMQDWRAAVKSTDSYRRLEEIARTGRVTIGESGEMTSRVAPPGYLSYLLKEEELWARSYAQYISSRSRNETMLAQVRARCYPSESFPIQ